MRWRVALLAAIIAAPQEAAPATPQPAITPDIIRIGRIKYHMAQTLGRMPNYTCTQTIERSRRESRNRKFKLLDTIRLEVALVDGKELFSWPGAGKFEDREISQIVGGGAIGNGNFALHARAVLMSQVPTYQFAGEFGEGTSKRYRYSYRVPRLFSGFKLRDGLSEGVAGYSGSFDVDADSLDLIRLEVIADDIPAHLRIVRTQDIMFYERTRIGDGDFLLPKSSEMTIASNDGTEGHNRVSFSGCRQYSGESTISFEDAPPLPETAPPTPTVAVEIPEGILLDVALSTPIPLQPVVIGTPIEGVVASNAKHRGATMIPKGAKARGRVVSAGDGPRGARSLVLEIFEVEFPGARAGIHATPDDASFFALGAGSRIQVSRDGVLYITGAANVTQLRKGTRWLWRTRQKPPEPSNNNQTGRQSQ